MHSYCRYFYRDTSASPPAVEAANFNYGEALQKAILFYEFQMSGKPDNIRKMAWRFMS